MSVGWWVGRSVGRSVRQSIRRSVTLYFFYRKVAYRVASAQLMAIGLVVFYEVIMKKSKGDWVIAWMTRRMSG